MAGDNYAPECLFCRIVSGEIPAQAVLETDSAYAFRDIDPQAPTHVLVVPRRHVTDADDERATADDLMPSLIAAAQQVVRNEGLSPAAGGNGYRLVMNVGADASNTVPHLHLHIIGGRAMTWPPG